MCLTCCLGRVAEAPLLLGPRVIERHYVMAWLCPPHPVAHVLGRVCCCCCLQCDIAMLTVDDDEFWEDVQPLEINGLPAMQESVMVVGFPTG